MNTYRAGPVLTVSPFTHPFVYKFQLEKRCMDTDETFYDTYAIGVYPKFELPISYTN
jgi:hypothetical protein